MAGLAIAKGRTVADDIADCALFRSGCIHVLVMDRPVACPEDEADSVSAVARCESSDQRDALGKVLALQNGWITRMNPVRDLCLAFHIDYVARPLLRFHPVLWRTVVALLKEFELVLTPPPPIPTFQPDLTEVSLT